MSFPQDFRDYQAWRNGFEATPERWVEYKKMEATYDDHQTNLLKYEIGLDLVDLVQTLFDQGVNAETFYDAVYSTYDWKALSFDDEPE